MSHGNKIGYFVVALLLGMVVPLGRKSEAHAGAILAEPGCTSNVIPANDDATTGFLPLGFDALFGDRLHGEVVISNNGYVTLGGPPDLWWRIRNWEAFGTAIIAPFLADVDTRPAATREVTYGPITVDGHPALCVNWIDVGYFDLHSDRLNSFQLILVSRSDVGPGDFDILMNYDRIAWDFSDGGPGIPPRIGYYDGSTGVELPGSLTTGTVGDTGTNPLVAGSQGSPVQGRYRFELRNGLEPQTAIVEGTIVDDNGVAVAGATVSMCPACFGVPSGPGACVFGSTDSSGNYSLRGFDASILATCEDWNVEVQPPGTTYIEPQPVPVTLTSLDLLVPGVDVLLETPPEIPSGTELEPSRQGANGVTTVFWAEPLTLRTEGCESQFGVGNTVARYRISQDGVTAREGLMTEGPLGVFTATLEPLYPLHGNVDVQITLDCPDGTSGGYSFSLYIDPSGWVLTTRGEPIVGARVTLYRSDYPLGPFEVVPDGSTIMAPTNRTNPDHTDASGHFGWDVMAGYYVVRAEMQGCVSPDDPTQPYVETPVLPVPPEWLDLRLYLDCEAITPPELYVPEQVTATATSAAGAVVEYEVWAIDGGDGDVPAVCWPQSGDLFPPGVTEVSCSASDSHGNVAHASFEVIVAYECSSVLPPLDPGGGSTLHLGRTVPVKFALTGASQGVTDAVAELYLARVTDGVPGPELPARSSGNANDGPRFRYEDGLYVFNWSTKKLLAGIYQLRIDLGDDVARTVLVELVR